MRATLFVCVVMLTITALFGLTGCSRGQMPASGANCISIEDLAKGIAVLKPWPMRGDLDNGDVDRYFAMASRLSWRSEADIVLAMDQARALVAEGDKMAGEPDGWFRRVYLLARIVYETELLDTPLASEYGHRFAGVICDKQQAKRIEWPWRFDPSAKHPTISSDYEGRDGVYMVERELALFARIARRRTFSAPSGCVRCEYSSTRPAR